MLSRKISVWLVSFLAVLVVYFIYNRLSRTPAIIPVNGPGQQMSSAVDACDANLDKSGIGKVGEVGIGVAKNVRYTTLNAQKQLEREFGFEELVHQDGNEWEIEEPYYTIYQRNFKCEIRGRRARITVDVAGGRVTPRQGVLTGNVTIRILPNRKGGPGEAVIYMDDIAFMGDKSMFSTAGQVQFVSPDAQLVGRGMELVYGGDEGQIELLKLSRLQSLQIKQRSGSTGREAGLPKKGTSGAEQGRQGKAGQVYRCVLDSNVVMETAGERLMGEVVTINDIFIARAESNESPAVSPADENQITEPTAIVQEDANLVAGDITISCDGGVVITPAQHPLREMDSPEVQIVKDPASPLATPWQAEVNEAARGGKMLVRGEKITYNVETGEAVATGPSHIVLDVNAMGSDGQKTPATVAMTAQRQAMFSPESNEVVFEGDTRGTISQQDGNAVRQYIVLADKLEIGLKRKDGDETAAALDINRLVATGDVVHLAGTRKIGERLLAGVELKCARMDYDANDGSFVAAGPGLIKVDNSQTDEPQKGLSRFSLRRKCYAFLRQFDSLKFDGSSNHLIADSNGGSMLVDYFPLAEDNGRDKVAVTASHVEADILETTQGRLELGGLKATGAVTYEDKDKQFAGNEFIYDVNNAMINIYGDKSRPCLFNGTIVDSVQYDVKANKAKAKIKGPGAIR